MERESERGEGGRTRGRNLCICLLGLKPSSAHWLWYRLGLGLRSQLLLAEMLLLTKLLVVAQLLLLA